MIFPSTSSDMFGLRSDMFRLGQICLVWGPDMSSSDKFREIMEITRSNLNSRIQI
jgi:hypothetical protein